MSEYTPAHIDRILLRWGEYAGLAEGNSSSGPGGLRVAGRRVDPTLYAAERADVARAFRVLARGDQQLIAGRCEGLSLTHLATVLRVDRRELAARYWAAVRQMAWALGWKATE